MYARAKGLGLGTNTEVESIAIKEDLEYYYEKHFTNFIIETDSLSLKQMILMHCKIPWELVDIIEELGLFIQKLNVTATHTFREGNSVSDSLANEVIETEDMQQYHSFHHGFS